MSSGGGGGQTVTQQQQIPIYEQQFSAENQDLARSLSSNPYPQYNQPLVQDFSPQQIQGMQMAGQAASSYQPDLNVANAWMNNGFYGNQPAIVQGQQSLNRGATTYAPGVEGGQQLLQNASAYMSPNDPNVIASYMSPYVSQALAPQVLALQTQLGQQQNALNAQATGANAFGDARQGVAQALNNFYGDQALNGLVQQGYNTAYQNANNTALQEQAQQAAIGNQYANIGLNQGNLWANAANQLGNMGLNSEQSQWAGANQMANLGQLQQQLGISGANALFNSGQQQQTLGQQELNQAYQQFLNQANWPYQMLNIRESALSNSPYNLTNATTVPQANMAAQGFGAALGGLGSLASLFGGSSSGSSAGNAPFGGTTIQTPH